MASKVVAEYAKSARSSCKKCEVSIAKDVMRLGIVSKGPRGIEFTKWHHLDCFPSASLPVTTSEIGGFSDLKEDDKEVLTKLVADDTKRSSEPTVPGKRKKNESADVCKGEDSLHTSEADDQEQRSSKNLKSSNSDKEMELHIEIADTDIMDKYKDANLLPKWKAFQTVIFLGQDDELHESNKIAAFDFDGCLAKTSQKRVGADGWSLLYPSIPDKLQTLYNEGYKLVIFTNESNIERCNKSRQKAIDSKLGRLNNFINLVKVPIQVFVACGMEGSGDIFRKPKPGMWRLMEQKFNSGVPVDMEQSFYVGGDAGRGGDDSREDIDFAEAVGLKFFVPEDFFLLQGSSSV